MELGLYGLVEQRVIFFTWTFLMQITSCSSLIPIPILKPIRVWPAHKDQPKRKVETFPLHWAHATPQRLDSTRPDPTRFKRAALDNQCCKWKVPHISMKTLISVSSWPERAERPFPDATLKCKLFTHSQLKYDWLIELGASSMSVGICMPSNEAIHNTRGTIKVRVSHSH